MDLSPGKRTLPLTACAGLITTESDGEEFIQPDFSAAGELPVEADYFRTAGPRAGQLYERENILRHSTTWFVPSCDDGPQKPCFLKP